MNSNQFPLFETLAILNGKWQNLALHQKRYESALKTYYSHSQSIQVYQFTDITVPQIAQQGLIRCRINYNAQQLQAEFFPYTRRKITTFQPIICDDIDYSLKYSDRSLLNQLLQQRGECDEIMIIKQGKVTDCSIGNLAFRQGESWYTPNTPLLNGTQRQLLLAQGIVIEKTICVEDIHLFDEIRIINALNPLNFS